MPVCLHALFTNCDCLLLFRKTSVENFDLNSVFVFLFLQVVEGFLTEDQKEQFIRDVVEIIEICRDHPRAALAVSTEGLSVSSSNRSVLSDISEDMDKVHALSSADTDKSSTSMTSTTGSAHVDTGNGSQASSLQLQVCYLCFTYQNSNNGENL